MHRIHVPLVSSWSLIDYLEARRNLGTVMQAVPGTCKTAPALQIKIFKDEGYRFIVSPPIAAASLGCNQRQKYNQRHQTPSARDLGHKS